MINVLLRLGAAIAFAFSSMGMLIMLEEYLFPGKVYESDNAVPFTIRFISYVALACLGGWLHVTRIKQEKKEQ